MPPSAVERELVKAIADWVPSLTGRVQSDTALFESGQFDSLALLNLVTWIEEQIGAPVDATSIDPVSEWSTIRKILEYVEQRRPRS